MLVRFCAEQTCISVKSLLKASAHFLPVTRSVKLYSSFIPPDIVSSPRKDTENDGYDLKLQDIAETLENDPNLEQFYDSNTLKQIKSLNNNVSHDVFDPYDFSSLPMVSETETNAGSHPILSDPNEPRTMTTEDFMKMMEGDRTSFDTFSDDIPSTDDYLSQMVNQTPTFSESKHTVSDSSKENTRKIDTTELNLSAKPPMTSRSTFLDDFLNKDDIPKYDFIPSQTSLGDICKTDLPLIIISKLTDPRLNLSIEKYVYDSLPDPRLPINKFVKRLLLYKNSSCIVLGKNQNIFREINLRLASTLSVPILRRYSGGGTVVHDLGNFNFSFMSSKDEFSRTGFTNELINNWNDYIERGLNPGFELSLNAKGDMVRKIDEKKISGSAFQISKGKSLHHGTMLLNSDLKTLSKLLKVDPNRLNSITDKATDSIPSPVINTNLNENLFLELCINSFTKKFGVPTTINEKSLKDNMSLIKHENLQVQILKIDDLTELPSEVWDTYNELKSWDWIFGKSPRFSIEFSCDNSNLDLEFTVNKGRVIELKWESKVPGDKRLDLLVKKLSSNENVINFSSVSLCKYIPDENLRKEISWHVDQSLNYDRIGIDH